jgi:AraC-like DNA-binding protein
VVASAFQNGNFNQAKLSVICYSGFMSLATKALWMIERNLGNELSLSDIAEGCGVSKFHLARAFEARVGIPVMQYVRARRLSKAGGRSCRRSR